MRISEIIHVFDGWMFTIRGQKIFLKNSLSFGYVLGESKVALLWDTL